MRKEHVIIELTDEQRQELEKPGVPRVRDPKTNATYVLVRTEVYDRLQTLLADDQDSVRDAYPAAMAVFAQTAGMIPGWTCTTPLTPDGNHEYLAR